MEKHALFIGLSLHFLGQFQFFGGLYTIDNRGIGVCRDFFSASIKIGRPLPDQILLGPKCRIAIVEIDFTISGEGSFFIRADSNLWPFLKETLIPVWYLDRPWQGPRNYRPTAGPGEGGSAITAGATGRFANLEGTAVESYELSGFDKIRGPGDLTARLFVSLPGKATSLAAE